MRERMVLFIVVVLTPTLRCACVGLIEYRVFDTGLIRVHHTFPVFIRYPLRLVSLAVVIHHHSVAHGLDFARLAIAKKLFHLEAGATNFSDTALADNLVVKQHRSAEIQVHMDEDVFEGQPIDGRLKNMLKITASTHVEVVALRPVVDVVVRVEVAHSDLDGTREHFS